MEFCAHSNRAYENGMACETVNKIFDMNKRKKNNQRALDVNMCTQSVANEEGNKMSILFNEVLDMMIYS